MAKTRIVIVGAGIVGVCTAYYITEHPKYDPGKYEVILLEAVRPASAASGKAGGLLSKSAFPHQIVPLSYDLHAKLAEQYNGADAWGFRYLNVVSIAGSNANSPDPTNKPDIPKELDWIYREKMSVCETLGGPQTYAQVQPYLFVHFLLRKVLERGAKLITGKVEQVNGKDNTATAVSYRPEGSSKSDPLVRLEADKIVICNGPWASRLVPDMPLLALKAHSITLKPTRKVSAFAMFTDFRISRSQYVSPEIYARKDEIFIAGEGGLEELPETANLVVPTPDQCEQLFEHASQISEEIRGGKIQRKQACFLPVVDSPSCTGPFIGNTDVENLILAVGHSCWGINNAPGTGFVVAELLLDGEVTSAKLKGLVPKDYFSAKSTLT